MKKSKDHTFNLVLLFMVGVFVLTLSITFGLAGFFLWGVAILSFYLYSKAGLYTKFKVNRFLKKISKQLGKVIIGVIGIFMVLAGIWNRAVEIDFNPENDDDESTDLRMTDNDTTIIHRRSWRDFRNHNYYDSIMIKVADLVESSAQQQQISIRDRANPWADIYNQLQNIDIGKLNLVYDRLSKIKEDQQLNRQEFAEVILTLIQDIDYKLIVRHPCSPEHGNTPFVRKFLRENAENCVGNVQFGVHSPVQFLGTLAGDCDTRTVLAHMVLRHYQYDVVIMNSREYTHSILGISLPYTGDYKLHRGRKYYFVELTAKGWQPGILPPKNNNINYWNVVM